MCMHAAWLEDRSVSAIGLYDFVPLTCFWLREGIRQRVHHQTGSKMEISSS